MSLMREIRHDGHAQIGSDRLRRRPGGRGRAGRPVGVGRGRHGERRGPRHHSPLLDGWRFLLVDLDGSADDSTGAADPAHDDSAWREVAVPHDWSIEQTPTTEHGTTSGTGFRPAASAGTASGSPCRPPSPGKRISVEFDGVYMDSRVHCNGREAGRHPYGYTGFALDLTDLVHTDGRTENVLAVQVRNRLPSSRWYSGSGIYREVRLVVTEPVHVRRWGTYVTTPQVSEERAVVRVETSVVNASGTAREVEIRSAVKDADGRTVARAASTARVAEEANEVHELTVTRPRMRDFATPHRYTLHTELRVGGRPSTPTAPRSASAPSTSTPRRASTQRPVRQDQGRRPAPRPRRTRRRRQHRRDPPPDDHREVDGRQRLPHLAQPARAPR